MDAPFNSATAERALQRLGELIDYPQEVELLLVGGAAGMLTGALPPTRTTTDCDVMVYIPAKAMGTVETAADRVTAELNLPPGWLNSKVQLRLDTLPDGWQSRRQFVLASGRLTVWAIGRIDLIAMKFIAGRPQDREDLRTLNIQTTDVLFVRTYLDALAAKGTTPEQINEARGLLDAWQPTDA